MTRNDYGDDDQNDLMNLIDGPHEPADDGIAVYPVTGRRFEFQFLRKEFETPQDNDDEELPF